MTPGDWAQVQPAAVGGPIIWCRFVAWRTAQTRQRQAEDTVRNGADPREATMAQTPRAVFRGYAM